MVSPKLSATVQEQLRQRANFLCEYCHTDETWQYIPFTIDHIMPVSEGGEDNAENLALACALRLTRLLDSVDVRRYCQGMYNKAAIEFKDIYQLFIFPFVYPISKNFWLWRRHFCIRYLTKRCPNFLPSVALVLKQVRRN
ncbi:MAG: HNH endonuclease [Acidobacteria bacterium]|nr:HNH endonuclease [Acidobacteriota bacterium]